MDRDLSLLADIRTMAADAITFLGDQTLEELQQDRQLQYALIRCLEVIGEGSSPLAVQTPEGRLVSPRQITAFETLTTDNIPD